MLRGILTAEWEGTVSPRKYADGVSACLENSRRLFEDSLTLQKAHRYPSAVALAILSLEEIDKMYRLLRIALIKEPSSLKREWAEWRDHKAKLKSVLRPIPAEQPKATAEVLSIATVHHLAQRLKLRSLYVTLLQDGTWSRPGGIITESLCRGMVIPTAFLLFGRASLLGFLADDTVEKMDMPTKATSVARRLHKWRRSQPGLRWAEQQGKIHEKWLTATAARFGVKIPSEPTASRQPDLPTGLGH
jgi:AbiV family abortive infection protein